MRTLKTTTYCMVRWALILALILTLPVFTASVYAQSAFRTAVEEASSDKRYVENEEGFMYKVTFVPGSPPVREMIPNSSVDIQRTDNRVSATIKTSGMGPNHHFTLWFILRNYDGAGYDDHCSPHAWAGVIGGGGTSNSFGDATISGSIRTEFIPEQDNTYIHLHFPGGGDMIFDNPRGVEILLAIRDHGPTQPGLVHEQTSTHGGGCNNDPEGDAGAPGDFPCVIVQQSNTFKGCLLP